MDIYKGRLEKFKNTQSIQWKMNLSIWTLLVLAIYKNDFIELNTCLLIILIFICLIHLGYCILTQKSINSDKAVTDNIIDALKNSEQENVNIDVKLKGKISNCPSWLWILLQTAITVVLSVIFYQVISNR